MKIDEILDKPLPFNVTRNKKDYFSAEFTAGEREIFFSAASESGDGTWKIQFAEEAEGQLQFDKSGNGNEFDVFSTLKAIITKFIQVHKPKVLEFSASEDEDDKNNRSRLYVRLFKKNLPGWKITRGEEKFGQVSFRMIKEGAVKRSDPYISGEKSGPRPPDAKLAPRPATAHRSKLETLVKKSGKSMEKVEAAWNRAAKEVADGPMKWAKVMIRVKSDLGISI